MRSLLVFTIFSWSTISSIAQTIEFFPNEVRGLDKTFVLNGDAGQSTFVKSVGVYNRTSQTLSVYARPHVESDALYFTDASGKTTREYSLQLVPGAGGTLHLFGHASSVARNYSGYLALAATPQYPDKRTGTTRTVKLPVSVNFVATRTQSTTKPATSAPQKPDRYEAIMQGGLPMRRHLKRLPLKVYSSHAYTGDTAAQYNAVVLRAVEVWNMAGRENGLSRDFFKIVQKPGQANIRIDWTGRNLLKGSDGTAYPSEGRIGMLPIGRYGGLGKAGETLMQELCHMLGVAHSEVRMDIMFGEGHSHSPELSKLSATARDKQMLAWLYSLTRYVALGE